MKQLLICSLSFNHTGRKVVVILCNKGSDISLNEEDAITAVIEELLGEKACILWQLGNKRKENVSVPSPQEQQQTEELEDMDVSYGCYVDVSHDDVPSKKGTRVKSGVLPNIPKGQHRPISSRKSSLSHFKQFLKYLP